MEISCYLCNSTIKHWCPNLVETKSKHSGTPIIEFIKKFLNDYASKRNINDKSNCICSDCLCRIHSYDWMCLKVKEQEREFRTLLLQTEIKFVANQIKIEHCDINSGAHFANGRTNGDENKSIDIKTEKKHEPSKATDVVKKSKPIIVRVVKRVPFLKSKPSAQTVQPNKLVLTIPSTSGVATKPNLKPHTPILKRVRVEIKSHTCPLCDTKFKQEDTLKVNISFNTKRNIK